MRKRLVWISLTLPVVAAAVAIATRGMGFSAAARPGAIETRLALAARRWATPSAARDRVNPLTRSREAIKEGMEHWADHCATCHGNDGSGGTAIGRKLYPPAPDMRTPRTQDMSDGELFYIIEHGVPFTGMPAWSTGTSAGEEDSWKLVLFIRHLPELTPEEAEIMEKLNPKSVRKAEIERQIDDFLKGKGGK